MEIKKSLKRISAFLSGLLMTVSVGGHCANAVGEIPGEDPYFYGENEYMPSYEDNQSYENNFGNEYDTEYGNTPYVEGSTQNTTENTTENTTASSQRTEVRKGKAVIDDYDSSLSGMNYELSIPEYTYYEDFSDNTLNEQQAEQAKKDIVISLREGNPVTSVRRAEDADLTEIGHVGEIPVSNEQDVSSEVSGEFTFVTYGWGHGVGMSQNGANFYATYAGWSYQDILAHYYPNTYLMNTGLTDYEELTINGEPAGDTVSVVAQIVNREIGGSMHYEAIKAQAVAVYTYIKYHNDDSADLLGKPDPPQNVIDACTEVLGEALYYNGSYALTMFSASTGGCTANCGEVFYADIPYLISVPSDYDEAYDPHYGTVTYYPASEVKRLIEGEYNIRLSDDPGKWIQPTYSQQTGYVTDVNIDDQLSIRGYELKLLLDLKSSKFNLTYTY